MAAIVGHLTPLQLVLYMDDLWIISDTFQLHLEWLECLFRTLHQHGLKANAKKCQFGMESVVFLWPQSGNWWRSIRSSEGEGGFGWPPQPVWESCNVFLAIWGGFDSLFLDMQRSCILWQYSWILVNLNGHHPTNSHFEILKAKLITLPIFTHQTRSNLQPFHRCLFEWNWRRTSTIRWCNYY